MSIANLKDLAKAIRDAIETNDLERLHNLAYSYGWTTPTTESLKIDSEKCGTDTLFLFFEEQCGELKEKSFSDYYYIFRRNSLKTFFLLCAKENRLQESQITEIAGMFENLDHPQTRLSSPPPPPPRKKGTGSKKFICEMYQSQNQNVLRQVICNVVGRHN